MRIRSTLAVGAALALTLGFAPADAPVPVFSKNIDVVNTVVDAGGISAAIDTTRPYMYLSTARGIDVYDISDPESPTLTGFTNAVVFENEAMNAGEAHHRDDGTTFVVTGADITPNAGIDDEGDPHLITGNGIYIFDVTDPTNPYLRSSLEPSTGTHTISCVDEACEYAYTSGGGNFSILDLRDLDDPKEVKVVDTPWVDHDWDRDDAGVLWSTGFSGSAAWNVDDPENPYVMNGTGRIRNPEALNFVHHNMGRFNAQSFTETAEGEQPLPYAVENGNLAVITEEDYDDPSCRTEGSFQTWGVPTLDPATSGAVPGNAASGNMELLDLWNTEIYETGEKTRAGAFCSAHYFTLHEDGLVAQGWYQQGLRILDVTDPTDIKQVGYLVAQGQETWIAYWVPERDEDGHVVRREDGSVVHTDLIYSLDTARGIDVVRFTAMDEEQRAPVEAPILPSWLGQVALFTPRADDRFGYACILPGV